MARGVVNEQMLFSAQDPLHPGEGGIVNAHKIWVIEVDARPIHRPENAVGDIGGAGIGKEVAAAGFAHLYGPTGFPWAAL